MIEPTIVHLYAAHPFGKDCCDALVIENEQRRTCARPRAEHFNEGELGKELSRLRYRVQLLEAGPSGVIFTVMAAARSYLEAQAALVAAGLTEERPNAARRLADAWIMLNRSVERAGDLR